MRGLLEREFDAKTIRVLLMDTGFKSVFHASADLVLGSGADLEYENAKGKMVGERLEAGTQLTVGPDSPYLEYGRMIITPDEPEAITIRSIERSRARRFTAEAWKSRERRRGWYWSMICFWRIT